MKKRTDVKWIAISARIPRLAAVFAMAIIIGFSCGGCERQAQEDSQEIGPPDLNAIHVESKKLKLHPPK